MQTEIKKAGVAILISDKIDFIIKTITRDKEGHYIMIKGSIQEEDKNRTNREEAIIKTTENKTFSDIQNTYITKNQIETKLLCLITEITKEWNNIYK